MTQAREVDGMFFQLPNGGILARQHKIVFRITKDEAGMSISLADETLGIMLEIPFESVEDMF